MSKITTLDEWSEERSLSQLEWEERYNLEVDLQKIYNDEEIQWQRRVGVRNGS